MVVSGSVTPTPLLAFACGSRSTSRIRRRWASAAARLTAVVVFPTPPFWLITPMMGKPVLRGDAVRRGYHRVPGAAPPPPSTPGHPGQEPAFLATAHHAAQGPDRSPRLPGQRLRLRTRPVHRPGPRAARP